jgi:hypothetical protein
MDNVVIKDFSLDIPAWNPLSERQQKIHTKICLNTDKIK